MNATLRRPDQIFGRGCVVMAVARRVIQYLFALSLATQSLLAGSPVVSKYSLGESGGTVVEEAAGSVKVSAEWVTNQKTMLDCFGKLVSKNPVVPVYLKVENTSTNRSYVISFDRIVLGSSEGSQTVKDSPVSPSAANPTQGQITGAAIYGFFTFGFLGKWVAVESLMDARRVKAVELRQRMLLPQFQTSTISPGKKAEGFVYFDASSGEPPQNPVIGIPMIQLGSSETNAVVLKLVR